MLLDRIVIENFRQYFGKHPVMFARDKKRSITILHGINGAGKTSFFLALNWCLYGRNAENVKVIENVGELMSKEAIKQAKPGESVHTSVELTFMHNEERYLVRRAIRGKKQKDGSMLTDENEDFAMMRTRADGNARRVDNPVGTMNSILPVNVRQYFLFDGEKIDAFAKPESADEVREAIYLVLKLEVLKRAQDHLEKSAQVYRRELSNLSSGELRDLIEQEERTHAERKKTEAQKADHEKAIEITKRHISDIDQRLGEIQGAKHLQKKREQLDRDLKQRRGELERNLTRIQELVVGGYFVLARGMLAKAAGVLEAKREKGEIPSSVRQQFIQDLLDEMRCICGRPLTDGSPEHQRLLGLLNHTLPGSVEDDVLNTSSAIKQFLDGGTRHRAELNDAMKHRVELTDIIKGLTAELDDVKRQLTGSPLEEISSLEKKRQEFDEDISRHNMDIGGCNLKIDSQTKEIARLSKEIAAAEKDEKRVRLLNTKRELAQESADAIGEMYAAFADDMRQKIEAKTKEIFGKLVWKDSQWQDVRLGPDFDLEVIDRYGTPARPELSAGERQVLSLSFITAMSRVSEEEAPLVMDTPFGRLSSQHRNNITKYIPDLADQLVLFVTDEELRDEARDNLKTRIGKEYRLVFDKKTGCTSIEVEK